MDMDVFNLSAAQFAAATVEKSSSRVIKAVAQALRATADADTIHQMRIACKRLETQLNLFERVLPPQYAFTRRAIRKIRRAASRPRELSILVAELESLMPQLQDIE